MENDAKEASTDMTNSVNNIKNGNAPDEIKSVDTVKSVKSMMEGREAQKMRGVPNGYQMRGECYMFGVKPNTMGTGKQWSTPITPGRPKDSAGGVVKKAQGATLDTSFREMMAGNKPQ